METLRIASGEPITAECKTIPRESPVGVIQASVFELRVRNRVFHKLDPLDNDPSLVFLDIHSGDIVKLIFETGNKDD